MTPVITAVGSSKLIANEIANLAKNIFHNKLSINSFSIDNITNQDTTDFYICAPTQYKKLCQIIPPRKVFIFELIPTSTFFLQIASIPPLSTVYVFNNLSQYTNTLIDSCHRLGITKLSFIPLAYESMPEQKLICCLKKAHYIIGVDRFLGTEALLSSHYKKYLPEDIKIIAAKRTASVRSSCLFLHAVSVFYYNKVKARYTDLLKANTISTSDELTNLAHNTIKFIDIIRAASVQIIANQIDLAAQPINQVSALNSLNNIINVNELSHIMDDLLLTFAILNEKLAHLYK